MPTRRNRGSKEPARYPEDYVAAVAILRTMGLGYGEIFTVFKRIDPTVPMSPATACRMAQQAESDGYLNQQPTIDLARLPQAIHHRALDLLVPLATDPAIQALVPSGHSCRVHVIQGEADTELGLAAFGRMAAHIVMFELVQVEHLGVAWGRVVYALVEGLRRLPLPARGSTQGPPRLTRVVPIVGEPIHVADSMHEYSSTLLAQYVSEALNPQPVRVPSLGGVPAYFPLRGKAKRAELLKFWRAIPAYANFIDKGGFFSQLDTIVTGIGVVAPVNGRQGVFVNERVVAERLDYKRMGQLVYGDLAGVLIPRRDIDRAGRMKVQLYNDGWTGLRLSDIQRCAQAANRSQHGGVIVVAAGAGKAELLREIVRAGLVNHLVIDVPLARALRALSDG
jgi:DNA-binding transcriptional regulator LsrR (DeoR family)